MKTIYQMKQEADWPVLLTDHQGFITYVNASFSKVFGWKNDEIIGQTLGIVIPNSYRDAHNLGFSRFAVTERSTVLNHPLQLMAVTKNGREILSEHFITAEQQQGQWVFGAILRPIEVE
jgi:PAS domain S-box-containing protein